MVPKFIGRNQFCSQDTDYNGVTQKMEWKKGKSNDSIIETCGK